jgi:hypothetical protein
MSIFPALVPSSRRFTPGRFPHTSMGTLSGRSARVRHGNVRVGQSIGLEFIALTEAQMLQILSHYQSRDGRLLSFTLPAEVLSRIDTPAGFTPTGYRWLYVDQPQVEEVPAGNQVVFNVSVELESIPPQGAIVGGGVWEMRIEMAGGAASGGDQFADGAALTITASLAAGAATA